MSQRILRHLAVFGLLPCLVGLVAVFASDPLLGISLVGLEATILGFILYRRERAIEGKWWAQFMLFALCLRFAMAFAHLAVGFWVYGGGVDFIGYFWDGAGVSGGFLRGNLGPLREMLERFYAGTLNLDVLTVNLLSGFLYFFTGPSLVGGALLSAIVGFWGSYLFLRAFQVAFPSGEGDDRFLALSLFLLPTFAYWTSLLGKDSWMFLFLGLVSYSAARLFQQIRIKDTLGLAVGLAGVTVIRSVIGFILVLGLGCAILLKRPKAAGPAAILKPVTIFVALALTANFITSMGPLLLEWRYTELLETKGVTSTTEALEAALRYQHEGSATTPAGSILEVVITEYTPMGILRYLPEGMFTVLFRPLIFEAHNPLALFAALENTGLLLLVLWRIRRLGTALRSVRTSGFIGFCVVVFLLITVTLGFLRNFGVIVRQRSMALPFLMILLALPMPSRRVAGIRPSPVVPEMGVASEGADGR